MEFELDDDPDRIDVIPVHDFLSNHAYWALGWPYGKLERLVREAQRVVGVYLGDKLARWTFR
jgi:hypothetical protein